MEFVENNNKMPNIPKPGNKGFIFPNPKKVLSSGSISHRENIMDSVYSSDRPSERIMTPN